MSMRYFCQMCERWFTRGGDCPKCGFKLEMARKKDA